MTLAIGSQVGSCEITGRVGTGGMGGVLRARDTRIGRDVALKVLPAEVSANADRLRRFEREARAPATLNHPRSTNSGCRMAGLPGAGGGFFATGWSPDGTMLVFVIPSPTSGRWCWTRFPLRDDGEGGGGSAEKQCRGKQGPVMNRFMGSSFRRCLESVDASTNSRQQNPFQQRQERWRDS